MPKLKLLCTSGSEENGKISLAEMKKWIGFLEKCAVVNVDC